MTIRARAHRSSDDGSADICPLLVFLRSPDFDRAYARAVYHLEQSGWNDVEILDHTIASAEDIARLGDAAAAAYERAARHGASFVVVASST